MAQTGPLVANIPGRVMNDTPARYRPDGTQALAELREISNTPDGLIEVRRLIDEGTPLLRAYIDRSAATETGDVVARYQLCEPLRVILPALRARDGQPNEIESAGHNGPSVKASVCAEIGPEDTG